MNTFSDVLKLVDLQVGGVKKQNCSMNMITRLALFCLLMCYELNAASVKVS